LLGWIPHGVLDQGHKQLGEKTIAITDEPLAVVRRRVDDAWTAPGSGGLRGSRGQARSNQGFKVSADGRDMQADLRGGVRGTEATGGGPEDVQEAQPAHLGEGLMGFRDLVGTSRVSHGAYFSVSLPLEIVMIIAKERSHHRPDKPG
jgi:hypothetical protein